jgi:hypothetical protein
VGVGSRKSERKDFSVAWPPNFQIVAQSDLVLGNRRDRLFRDLIHRSD